MSNSKINLGNIVVTIIGESPLLMHDDKTANPFNDFTKSLKKMTSKRNKTEDDLLEISKLEWEASLYYDYKKESYFMKSDSIEATLLGAAKLVKKGTLIKQSMIIADNGTFEFQHNSLSPKQLFLITDYVDIRTVKVNRNKIFRTRPIFNEWQSKFSIAYDISKMDKQDIIDIIENAGKYIGLCDYRPKYGRFSIKEIK